MVSVVSPLSTGRAPDWCRLVDHRALNEAERNPCPTTPGGCQVSKALEASRSQANESYDDCLVSAFLFTGISIASAQQGCLISGIIVRNS